MQLSWPGLAGWGIMRAMSGYSVFIPVLDEEEIMVANTMILLEHCRALGRGFEVLIVSNGSTDSSEELGRSLAVEQPEVRFRHLPGKGPGRAFSLAVSQAAYPYIITLDMDLSVGPEFVDTALGILDGGATVVVGSKQAGRQERGWLRVVASGAFILAARLLLGLSFRDYSMAAKGFRVDFLRGILDRLDAQTGYTLASVYLAQKMGRTVVEVPVACQDLRESRFSLWREGVYRLGHLLRLRLGLS